MYLCVRVCAYVCMCVCVCVCKKIDKTKRTGSVPTFDLNSLG